MASGKLRLDISSWRAGGRLCARGSGVLSGRARAAATTRMRAGWEPEPWGGRGPLAARPSFQVSLGPKAGWGAGGRGSAGRAAPAREGQVRGAARGLTTLSSTRGPAGSRRCERGCGIARGRPSFAPTDGRPKGASGSVGGEPAKGLETRRQAGDRSRAHCLARHAGRLGAGAARGGAGPLADARPAPGPRAGAGPALRQVCRRRLPDGNFW